MTTGQPTDRKPSDWIKVACWVVIAAYIVDKTVRLIGGASLSSLFDFANPSLAGIVCAVAVIVLILRSPKLLRSTTMIEANEARTVTLSFLFVFTLMAAYYILRPVRDADRKSVV